jgi:8-oxo-dGTP pyrophosphatase MutT (NUDIX family)
LKHRIRLSGIARRGAEILLVEQRSPHTGLHRWSVPGGGLEYTDADIFKGIEREMFEETGLTIRPGGIRFTNEFIHLSTQTLMIDLWVDCFPPDGHLQWAEPSLVNVREDDYITDLRWWSYAALQESTVRVNPNLLRPDFWAHLEAPISQVLHLGRWSE